MFVSHLALVSSHILQPGTNFFSSQITLTEKKFALEKYECRNQPEIMDVYSYVKAKLFFFSSNMGSVFILFSIYVSDE